MLTALALIIFCLGVLWHCWRLSGSSRRTKPVHRIADVVVGACLFAIAASLVLKELLNLPVSLWSVLSLFPIFFLFIDAAHSALRFHAEDMGRR